MKDCVYFHSRIRECVEFRCLLGISEPREQITSHSGRLRVYLCNMDVQEISNRKSFESLSSREDRLRGYEIEIRADTATENTWLDLASYSPR